MMLVFHLFPKLVVHMVQKAKEQAAKKLGVPGKILVPVENIIRVVDKERELAEYKAKAEKEIANLKAQKNREIADKDKKIADKDKEIADKDKEIADLKRRLVHE